VVPAANAQGDWRITRIAATGPQARITLRREDTVVEAAMTADALLDSGLTTDMRASVIFTGGTLFGPDEKLLAKLVALQTEPVA
jgi:hypothetical protein